MAIVLLRNEYVTRDVARAPDHVLVEIVGEVYVPLVHGRGPVSPNDPLARFDHDRDPSQALLI
jgi:hypothetical protein